MFKTIGPIVLLLVCTMMVQAQDAITVKMDVPQTVVAGQEFTVTVNIEKGTLEEFSRFQQELPAGFTAIQENSGSADFSFDNQRIRFIWLKLPAEPVLNISYKVKVHERLKGDLSLFGEFSYVEDNERRSIVIDRKSVAVEPSPDVPADQQVAIADFASVMASEKAEMASGIDVSCIRQVPYKSRTGNDIMVHLLVYKKDMNKFAKIEETVPAGFEARAMESKDGLFTFKDGVAKFVWMNLPAVEGFKISYRLIPEAGKTAADARITGVLSYIQEGRNITVDVVQQDIDLAAVNDDNISEFIASLGTGTAVTAVVPDRKETETVKPPPDPVVEEKVEEKVESQPVKSQPGSSSAGIPADQLLPVYDGVYFRVQLAATRRFQDAGSLFNKYRLSRKVLVEKQAGLFKYTAGSFSNYTQAKAFKDTAVSRGLRDAFVVAYRNGKRIDIMDALQATGGK